MPKPSFLKAKERTASALTRALRFEKTGMKFFTAAADKAADPQARQMFALLAQMEDKHMRDIVAIAKSLEEDGKFPEVTTAPSDARMRLFKRELARIRKETVFSGDAATTMRRALGFEAEGREMYSRMAENTPNPREKKFFKILAGEEEKHFEIIYEYLDSFENIGLRMRED